MVRRTKEDALATRSQLLDAAERVFADKGVSRASLQDIAQAAGASRGAIYWHFRNKADLFNAMMERVTLPMETALRGVGQRSGSDAPDALEDLHRSVLDAVRQIAGDARTRRVFEVATHKVEYVDELLAIKQRHQRCLADGTRDFERSLREAAAQRATTLPVAPAVAAHGLHALVVGLIQNWLLEPGAFDLEATADQVLRTYLAGLGLGGVTGGPG